MSEAPERELARALEHGLRPEFAERAKTALHLAELLLDSVDEALPLSRGKGDSAELEILAQRADVYGWDGPPGWDEVLARGIAERGATDPQPPPLPGLGAAEQRDEQRTVAQERIRHEAQRLLDLGREAAQLGSSSGSSATELTAHPTLPPGGILVGVHASLLRLLALSGANTLLLDNALDLEAVVGAIGAWQPERWQALRHGVPSAWMSELCPAESQTAGTAALASECEHALDLLGRLWNARGLSLTGFAALATLFFARTCSALALREELG